MATLYGPKTRALTFLRTFCLSGGRNGYGAKLANIFSTEFTVETAYGARSGTKTITECIVSLPLARSGTLCMYVIRIYVYVCMYMMY